MRIVDTEGQVVAASRDTADGTLQLAFDPRVEMSYLSPATAEVSYESSFALQRIQATGYRLEMYLAEGAAGTRIEGALEVVSTYE